MVSEFGAKDFILLLLNSDNQKPVSGKLFIQKEMFLIVEEIYKEIDDELCFEPYNYGPYSSKLVEILKDLNKDNLIKTNKSFDEFSITESGENYLKNINFSEDIIKKVNNLKIGSNKLGYKGLLRYVYFNYPEYTTKSKIKDEVLGD